MSREREEPVYYREIQKNGYLKRVPPDGSTKLRPLGHKRAAPEAMWTVLCVHNGRTPYLEQYAAQEAAGEHRPAWRASLQRARHVTASVRPWPGDEYDFLVASEPPVRMLAPTWDVMQEWVAVLRSKLHELKLLGRGENVYCAPPAPPPPRAGTRDPTSPLPPPPAGPAVRVPGVEPIVVPSSVARSNAQPATEAAADPSARTGDRVEATVASDSTETLQDDASVETAPEEPARERPSDWDAAMRRASPPPAGAEPPERAARTARICGRNVCVDAPAPRRPADSDEEFFAEIDRISAAGERFGDFVVDEACAGPSSGDATASAVEETLRYDEAVDSYTKVDLTKKAKGAGFTQRVVVSSESEAGGSHEHDESTNNSGSNITVIQVSNHRGPPHTAIPLLNSHADVFDFEFKHKLSVGGDPGAARDRQHFVNIVNTEETRVHENGYGAVFKPEESPYGHISLTTTVKLTGEKEPDEGIYERLCMASTSNDAPAISPLSKRKIKDNVERLKVTNGRKTSLPNLETKQQRHDSNPAYEYLFPLNNNTRNNGNEGKGVKIGVKSLKNQNCNDSNVVNLNTGHSPTIDSQSNTSVALSTTASNLPANISTGNVSNVHAVITNAPTDTTTNRRAANAQCDVSNVTHTTQSTVSTAHTIFVNSGSNSGGRGVERSQSQSSYDASVRLLRERARNGKGSRSPRRESGTSKNEKAQPDCKAGRGLFLRGLTELSFLSRLKGLGQAGGKPSPARADCEPARPAAVSPVKVVRRSRTDSRPADPARRRSSSLSGAADRAGVGGGGGCGGAAVSLRARQAAALRAEQARGAAAAARLARHDAKREPPVMCDAHGVVWVAWWGRGGAWFGGRAGDRVAAVRGVRPRDAAHARQLLRQALGSVTAHTVDVLFHRVPHAKIYVLTKDKEEDSIGIKLDGECGIVSVEAGSAAARAGLPPTGPRWAVTEVNNRPLDLLKGGEEELARLSARGLEVSVLLQPLPLVQKLRSALTTHRILHAVNLAG